MDTPDVLEQTLTEMSHQQLLDLVLKVASDRADFGLALLANINLSPQSRNSQLVWQLKQQIVEFFDAIQERYRYFAHEYDEDERYPELDPTIEAAKFLHPIDRIEVFWHLITCSNQMFEERRFPIGTQLIEEAISLYVESANQFARSPDKKQPYFDSLIDALSWEMCGYGEVSDALERAFDLLCEFADDYRYAIAKLQNSHYSRSPELIANFYLKLGDEANYLRIRQANLKTEENYLELANYWLKQGNKAKYLSILEAGALDLLENCKKPKLSFEFLSLNSLGKSSKLLQTLADSYQLKGDRENWCRILMAIAQYSGVTLELYQQIKTVSASLGTWQAREPKLLELAQRNPETLAEIHLFEENWSAAIYLASKQPHTERLQVLVAEGVKEHHPEKSIEIYEQLVQHYIGLKSRDSYRTAARHADAIKSIYLSIVNNPDTWRQYIKAIRNRYPRYRALQDEFRRL